LVSISQIDNANLIQCRELAGRYLGGKQQLPTGYVFKPSLAPRSMKRKAEQVDDYAMEDDIYDGIKRLYNEDVLVLDKMSYAAVVRASCASELRQDTDGSGHFHVDMPTVGAN
jgi:hypothetical protein